MAVWYDRFMRIALVHDVTLPVAHYGGTERIVWWLAKALHEAGHEVLLVCRPGSQCPFATVVAADFSQPIPPQVPAADVYHYFNTPPAEPEAPHVVTIQGNGKLGETFLANTSFISRNHAERHGATCFVYNALDPDDYVYRAAKEPYLLFLAKASWRVKNVKGTIRIARRARRPLRIVGGSSPLKPLWKLGRIHWEGMLGGERKAKLVAGASGLVFPVLWHEPFGIAVIEALVSGTPVLASPHGSLPELVPPEVGLICRTEAEFVEGVARLGTFRPEDCRDWVLERFHYRRMARDYEALYEKVLSGETLNPRPPRTIEGPDPALPTPDRPA